MKGTRLKNRRYYWLNRERLLARQRERDAKRRPSSRPFTPYTPEQKTEILRLYILGEKTEVISAMFGCANSYPGVLAERVGLAKRRAPHTRRAAA